MLLLPLVFGCKLLVAVSELFSAYSDYSAPVSETLDIKYSKIFVSLSPTSLGLRLFELASFTDKFSFRGGSETYFWLGSLWRRKRCTRYMHAGPKEHFIQRVLNTMDGRLDAILRQFWKAKNLNGSNGRAFTKKHDCTA